MNLRNSFGRHRRIYHHDVGKADDASDRRDVANEIEIKLLIQRGVDRVTRSHREQRIAVGRRANDRLGGDIAAGTRPILDDEWLTESFRQPLTHQTCHDVRRATGSERNDDAHRSCWIGLRPRDAGRSRERDSARGQMQKSSTGEYHDVPVKLCNACSRPLRSQ
jgi:hypothetical protein